MKNSKGSATIILRSKFEPIASKLKAYQELSTVETEILEQALLDDVIGTSACSLFLDYIKQTKHDKQTLLTSLIDKLLEDLLINTSNVKFKNMLQFLWDIFQQKVRIKIQEKLFTLLKQCILINEQEINIVASNLISFITENYTENKIPLDLMVALEKAFQLDIPLKVRLNIISTCAFLVALNQGNKIPYGLVKQFKTCLNEIQLKDHTILFFKVYNIDSNQLDTEIVECIACFLLNPFVENSDNFIKHVCNTFQSNANALESKVCFEALKKSFNSQNKETKTGLIGKHFLPALNAYDPKKFDFKDINMNTVIYFITSSKIDTAFIKDSVKLLRNLSIETLNDDAVISSLVALMEDKDHEVIVNSTEVLKNMVKNRKELSEPIFSQLIEKFSNNSSDLNEHLGWLLVYHIRNNRPNSIKKIVTSFESKLTRSENIEIQKCCLHGLAEAFKTDYKQVSGETLKKLSELITDKSLVESACVAIYEAAKKNIHLNFDDSYLRDLSDVMCFDEDSATRRLANQILNLYGDMQKLNDSDEIITDILFAENLTIEYISETSNDKMFLEAVLKIAVRGENLSENCYDLIELFVNDQIKWNLNKASIFHLTRTLLEFENQVRKNLIQNIVTKKSNQNDYDQFIEDLLITVYKALDLYTDFEKNFVESIQECLEVEKKNTYNHNRVILYLKVFEKLIDSRLFLGNMQTIHKFEEYLLVSLPTETRNLAMCIIEKIAALNQSNESTEAYCIESKILYSINENLKDTQTVDVGVKCVLKLIECKQISVSNQIIGESLINISIKSFFKKRDQNDQFFNSRRKALKSNAIKALGLILKQNSKNENPDFCNRIKFHLEANEAGEKLENSDYNFEIFKSSLDIIYDRVIEKKAFLDQQFWFSFCLINSELKNQIDEETRNKIISIIESLIKNGQKLNDDFYLKFIFDQASTENDYFRILAALREYFQHNDKRLSEFIKYIIGMLAHKKIRINNKLCNEIVNTLKVYLVCVKEDEDVVKQIEEAFRLNDIISQKNAQDIIEFIEKKSKVDNFDMFNALSFLNDDSLVFNQHGIELILKRILDLDFLPDYILKQLLKFSNNSKSFEFQKNICEILLSFIQKGNLSPNIPFELIFSDSELLSYLRFLTAINAEQDDENLIMSKLSCLNELRIKDLKKIIDGTFVKSLLLTLLHFHRSDEFKIFSLKFLTRLAFINGYELIKDNLDYLEKFYSSCENSLSLKYWCVKVLKYLLISHKQNKKIILSDSLTETLVTETIDFCENMPKVIAKLTEYFNLFSCVKLLEALLASKLLNLEVTFACENFDDKEIISGMLREVINKKIDKEKVEKINSLIDAIIVKQKFSKDSSKSFKYESILVALIELIASEEENSCEDFLEIILDQKFNQITYLLPDFLRRYRTKWLEEKMDLKAGALKTESIKMYNLIFGQSSLNLSVSFLKTIFSKLDYDKTLMNFDITWLFKKLHEARLDIQTITRDVFIDATTAKDKIDFWTSNLEIKLIENLVKAKFKRLNLDKCLAKLRYLFKSIVFVHNCPTHFIESIVKAALDQIIETTETVNEQKILDNFIEIFTILNENMSSEDHSMIESIKLSLEKSEAENWPTDVFKAIINNKLKSNREQYNLNELLEELQNMNSTKNEKISEMITSGRLKKEYLSIIEVLKSKSVIYHVDTIIEKWTTKDVNEWSKILASNFEQSLFTRFDLILEIVAVVSQAVFLFTHYKPRCIQLLSLIILIDGFHSNQSRLMEIKTGEGKSIVIGMFAVVLALFLKKNVDIITTSPVLAQRDCEELTNFYEMFNLTVAHNSDINKSGPKDCYKANVVYGDVKNFQYDVLRDEYEMLGTLNDRKFDYAIVDEVDSLLIDDNNVIAMLSFNCSGAFYLEALISKIWNEMNKIADSIKIIGNEKFYFDRNENNTSKIKLNSSESDFVLGKLIKMKEKFIEESTIPQHLTNLVKTDLEYWIVNSVDAKYLYNEDIHYLVYKDTLTNSKSLAIIDHENTGVIKRSTKWPKWLHQFIEIKHKIRLTNLSFTTKFISNYSFFKRYNNKLYGLTGTLGQLNVHKLLENMYKVDCVLVPTYKPMLFYQLNGVLLESDFSWLKECVQQVYKHAQIYKRAVLVICQSKRSATTIYNELMQVYKLRKDCVKLYTRDDTNEKHIVKYRLNPGDIIIATNLAGRGTDIKLSNQIEINGGLHVLVAFLPKNYRVERQAFGRTARKGQKGTAQIITYSQKFKTFDDLVEDRFKRENTNIQTILDKDLPVIEVRDILFHRFCQLIKKIPNEKYSGRKKEIVKQSIEEQFGLWLIEEYHMILRDFNSKRIDKTAFQEKSMEKFTIFEDSLIKELNSGSKLIKSSTYLVNFAIQAIYEKDYSLAQEYLREAINKDEQFSAFAHYYLANVLLLEAKKTHEASNHLKQAREKIINVNLKLIENVISSLNLNSENCQLDAKSNDLQLQFSNRFEILKCLINNIDLTLKKIDNFISDFSKFQSSIIFLNEFFKKQIEESNQELLLDVFQYQTNALKMFIEWKIKFVDSLFLPNASSLTSKIVSSLDNVKWLSYEKAKLSFSFSDLEQNNKWSIFNNPVIEDLLVQEFIPNPFICKYS